MRQINLTNTGGFPFTQEALAFLQLGYTEAISAIAASFGNKVIVGGMTVAAGTVADGWFIYNGEVIKFIESAQNTYIKITNTGTNATFEDGIDKSVFFEKTAVCDYSGDFAFADLVRMSSYNELEKLKLDRTWLTGDIKQVFCDASYITTNFDSAGLGRLERDGWAVCNGNGGTENMGGRVLVGMQYPAITADPANNVWDVIYNTALSVGGEKKHLLTKEESGLPAHTISIQLKEANTAGNNIAQATGSNKDTATINIAGFDAANSHENRQPFKVALFIQKL